MLELIAYFFTDRCDMVRGEFPAWRRLDFRDRDIDPFIGEVDGGFILKYSRKPNNIDVRAPYRLFQPLSVLVRVLSYGNDAVVNLVVVRYRNLPGLILCQYRIILGPGRSFLDE